MLVKLLLNIWTVQLSMLFESLQTKISGLYAWARDFFFFKTVKGSKRKDGDYEKGLRKGNNVLKMV